jgi:hypothetical protein
MVSEKPKRVLDYAKRQSEMPSRKTVTPYRRGVPGIFVKSIQGMKGKHYIEKAVKQSVDTFDRLYDEVIKDIEKNPELLNKFSKDDLIKTKVEKAIKELEKKNLKAERMILQGY